MEALGKFYDRHSPMVYGLCLQLVGENESEAEELLIHVFEKFWQSRSHLLIPPDGLSKCLLAFAIVRAKFNYGADFSEWVRRRANLSTNDKSAVGEVGGNLPRGDTADASRIATPSKNPKNRLI